MDDLNTILLWRLCRRAGAPSLSALLFALEGGDSASLKPDRPMPFINLWQAAVHFRFLPAIRHRRFGA